LLRPEPVCDVDTDGVLEPRVTMREVEEEEGEAARAELRNAREGVENAEIVMYSTAVTQKTRTRVSSRRAERCVLRKDVKDSSAASTS
jgi:hypothetical protein